MSVLVSAVAFLVAIAILVAVHEYGHFAAARLAGVRVLRFSIGFGRPIWMWRAGPDRTEYCISQIPFGGYVKLLDERDCPVALAEQPRAFNRQGVPARVFILAAGPALNFLFAIVAYWAMFMLGVPGTRPLIGTVEPGSVAATAGLAGGEQIVAVGGRATATWDGAVVAMLDRLLEAGRIDLTVRDADGRERGVTLDTAGRAAELTEPGRLFPGLGFEPWTPPLPAVVGEVLPGGAAERAGLQPQDRILAADGEPVTDWPAWVRYVRERPGVTVTVQVGRDGQEQALTLEIERAQAEEGEIGRIGAAPQIPEDLYEGVRAVERYAPLPALGQALARSWEMASLTVRMVARMVTGEVSVRNISGPINIAQYAGYSASIGVVPFLSFLAIVSISLGILNLLPVPMLDGGQIAYQLIEAAKGSPLSERSQIIGQQVGIALLLLLMTFAFYNDLSRLLG
ncbi:MAG: RIP metalloprotease RseP [Gammaproteobacteria bacterium]|nr:RIP metalloprotease RseP [Gammaproteobacteria bacterium]